MDLEEDLDNLFEEDESRENAGETNGMEINGDSNKESSTGEKVQPHKRIVKNPRLKFNPERLCGDRGIPILMDHFKDVKFKGKGYEKEDLNKLLSKLEHWTHRLFPSMKFEDCLRHIEKLGKKRQVQTCLRKIRLNMPILDEDFVKDNDEDDIRRNEDEDPVEMDAFDKLLGENQSSNSLTVENEIDSFSMFPPPSQNMPTSASQGQVLGSSGSTGLTEEQKERLEYNRMLAIERRKARLAQQSAGESFIENNERISQGDPITQDSAKGNMFDSLLENNPSFNDENENTILSDVNNQNSDNLGLDDLIDLVDREEHDSDRITNSPLEQSTSICEEAAEKLSQDSKSLNLKTVMSCNSSEGDDNNSNMNVMLETPESTKDKSLELDSLMDLINDDSEECQQHSDLLEHGKHDSSYTHDQNLICDEKRSSAMDYEENCDPDSPTLVIVEDI